LDENGRSDLTTRIPKLSAQTPREVVVPEVEFEQLLRVSPPSLEICLLLAHEAGLRSSAALNLARAQCDFDGNRVIGKTKGGTMYDLPMTARLRERLLWFCAAAQNPNERLTAVYRTGRKPLTPAGLRSEVRAAKLKAGLGSVKWTLHDLRRTAARKLYAATGDIRKVQAMLGHKMLWTTCWYLGNAIQSVTAEDMEEATKRTA
jgi:integrase